MAGAVLASLSEPAKSADQTCLPLCASNAVTLPCSPCTNTRSRVPLGVVTLLSSTGAPSGTSVSGTENSFFKPVTWARLTAVSSVSSAVLASSKPNWSRSYLAACGAAAAVLVTRPKAVPMTAVMASNRWLRVFLMATPSMISRELPMNRARCPANPARLRAPSARSMFARPSL